MLENTRFNAGETKNDEEYARRLADGFVIVANGRYVGMGTAGDVVRTLQSSRVLAARYTNPLTMLPGQVPINEHLERLLTGRVPFTAWFVEVDQMRGLNDSLGFTAGDALIHATARLLEAQCEPGVDFAGCARILLPSVHAALLTLGLVPADLDAICRHCLAKQPELRYKLAML